MIKGGGGALTREKIVAAASKKFVCIAHAQKYVELLGTFPVAVEVIPIARSSVARKIVKLGGTPEYREGFQTDNGNVILDVYGFKLIDPLGMEQTLNNLPGVVCNGVFAMNPADILLLASDSGIETIKRK
jgi:ribose 5-phosphate isomerase A